MSQTGKPNPNTAPAREAAGVDIEVLEKTVEEVVETLDVTVQAAEFVRARSTDPTERARAAGVRQKAKAMLDAARELTVRPPRRSEGRIVH